MFRGAYLAAGGLTIPLWAQWFAEQMEKLRPRKYIQLFQPEIATSGLQPIYGQPGLFRDLSTGKTINIRDF